jgi:hypothetical protein
MRLVRRRPEVNPQPTQNDARERTSRGGSRQERRCTFGTARAGQFCESRKPRAARTGQLQWRENGAAARAGQFSESRNPVQHVQPNFKSPENPMHNVQANFWNPENRMHDVQTVFQSPENRVKHVQANFTSLNILCITFRAISRCFFKALFMCNWVNCSILQP